ncbi:MAG: dihydroneopterin aldolase [Thermoleophilia bacterium]
MASKEHPLRITIKGLEVFAYHGVLPEEKKQGQPFLFDIGLSQKQTSAPETDDIADTVDYAAVCDRVAEVATAGSYNLLEKLAAVVADDILERFPAVDRVKVRIAKTSPPISHPVSQVAVMLKRTRA